MININLSAKEFNALYKALSLRKQYLAQAKEGLNRNMVDSLHITEELELIDTLLKRLLKSGDK